MMSNSNLPSKAIFPKLSPGLGVVSRFGNKSPHPDHGPDGELHFLKLRIVK